MLNNCHVINFQNLKKFFPKISKSSGNYSSSRNSNDFYKFDHDSRIFGSAYHKILEQDEQIIKKIAKFQLIRDLNSIVENYNLSVVEKNILLKMVKKIYSHNFYKNAICAAKYIHKEQNLCHFITKNKYVFRLEAVIDGILAIHGKNQIIIDYKTVNSIKLVNKQINESFYWMQLYFYKYIYENCLRNNKIFDLILFFQSKNSHDDYEIVIKKFSDLPKQMQKEYEETFHNSLQEYIDHYCRHGNHENLPKKNDVKSKKEKKMDGGKIGSKIIFVLILLVIFAIWFMYKG